MPIDKLAASGDYMIADITNNKIIATLFVMIVSIVILNEIPNFNELLEKKE